MIVKLINQPGPAPISTKGYDGYPIFEGDRIEIHPATDYWMQGARFGRVLRITSCAVDILLDRKPGIIECAHDLVRRVNDFGYPFTGIPGFNA